MVQRQERDQAPLDPSAQRGPESRSRLAQASDAAHRSLRLELEVPPVPPEGKPLRQVSVGTGRMDRHGLARGEPRIECQVDKGNLNLGAGVVLLLGGPSGREPVAFQALTCGT